ncbi:HIT family protein [Helicovermis profundi]|uniref:HIT family protein n=1 Tax=Helicovermis profundi TaxID=3065157 RepID=A0AAU9E1X4_9FIRM|nr:HIT family protein [Clostridia bacterium S502]
MNCIFCSNLNKIKETNLSYAIYDKFPVNKGHILIIPKRHISSFFELQKEEKDDLFELLDEMKLLLDKAFKPDAYNIGINDGIVAGQSIMHLHIHLIPRYKGDLENPKGGVRGVIPSRMGY